VDHRPTYQKLEEECKEIVFGSKPEDVLSGTNSNGDTESKGDKGNTETKEAVMHDKSANKKHIIGSTRPHKYKIDN
jgi:hypothetical protein